MSPAHLRGLRLEHALPQEAAAQLMRACCLRRSQAMSAAHSSVDSRGGRAAAERQRVHHGARMRRPLTSWGLDNACCSQQGGKYASIPHRRHRRDRSCRV